MPRVLVNSMRPCLYHKSSSIPWVNIYTMSPECWIREINQYKWQKNKRRRKILESNFHKNRNTWEMGNTEILITEIHKYKLQVYKNKFFKVRKHKLHIYRNTSELWMNFWIMGELLNSGWFCFKIICELFRYGWTF